jgi:hypothetical protein
VRAKKMKVFTHRVSPQIEKLSTSLEVVTPMVQRRLGQTLEFQSFDLSDVLNFA